MGVLQRVVLETDSRAGRAFDLTIQALILISLVTFCVETLPGLSESTRSTLQTIELVTVILFSIEYVLRIAVADRPLRYIFSFYGLVDLVAVLPFYLSTGLDLRALRVVRLARLVRVLKLMRYTRAVDRFRRATVDSREELLLYLAATCVLMFIASVGIYYCEHAAQPQAFASVFDAMWWAVATFTTVGYGDVYPVTVGGKLLTFVVLVLGLGLVAVPSAILASALTRVREEDRSRELGGQEVEDLTREGPPPSP